MGVSLQASVLTSEIKKNINKNSNNLKMISKGFVLFKINSSPSAFYIIKPTCISWLVFKVSKYLKKIVEKRKPERLFPLASDDVISGQNPNIQLVYTWGRH